MKSQCQIVKSGCSIFVFCEWRDFHSFGEHLLLSPLQAVEVPSPTRGAMASAVLEIFSWIGRKYVQLENVYQRNFHSSNVTMPQSWGFHRCFCSKYLEGENDGVSSDMQQSAARFCPLPMTTLVAATRRFPAWRHWNILEPGAPKGQHTKKHPTLFGWEDDSSPCADCRQVSFQEIFHFCFEN